MAAAEDPVLDCLATEGRKLSKGNQDATIIATHLRLDHQLWIPPLPEGHFAALRGFVPSTLPRFTGGGYRDVAPIPASPYEWACHLEGACINYSLYAKDLWSCRATYLGSRWEKALVSPYNRRGRSWRVVSILEDESELIQGCIVHHRHPARFPGVGEGGGSGLLIGEHECAFALLGRQRAMAKTPVEGRVRITSVTDTGIRVLEATLDETANPITVCITVLKTASLEDIRDDENEWLELVYLTMKKELIWESDQREQGTEVQKESLRTRVVSEDLGFSGSKESEDSYSSSVSSSL